MADDRPDLPLDEPAGEPVDAEGAGSPIGRRLVLGVGGLGVLGVLLGAKVQRGLDRALRPVTLRDGTGLTDLLPTAERFRIYSVTDGLPSMRDADYRLQVTGAVDAPATYTLEDLRTSLPQTKLVRDFQCVTGWRVPKVAWQGVLLRELLDRAGVHADATHVHFGSFDGAYTESLYLRDARRDDVIVAHQMLGKAVTLEHGGPVRLCVAPMYGYKSIKWLDRIEVTVGLIDQGYWEARGYDVEAWVGKSNGRSDAPIG